MEQVSIPYFNIHKLSKTVELSRYMLQSYVTTMGMLPSHLCVAKIEFPKNRYLTLQFCYNVMHHSILNKHTKISNLEIYLSTMK